MPTSVVPLGRFPQTRRGNRRGDAKALAHSVELAANKKEILLSVAREISWRCISPGEAHLEDFERSDIRRTAPQRMDRILKDARVAVRDRRSNILDGVAGVVCKELREFMHELLVA